MTNYQDLRSILTDSSFDRDMGLVRLQGFRGAEAEVALRSGIGGRLAPGICGAGAILGVVFASPPLLGVLALSAVVGTFAANSAPLTKIPQYAATLRSRDVQLVTIFQDYGQVVRRWGRDNARSVLNNHVARVLLPGMADTDLLEIFSNLVGERQAVNTTVSHGTAGPSSSETRRWERLAPVSELRTLLAGHAVLIHDNTLPAKVRLRPCYKQPQWRHLGGWLGPPVPTGAGPRLLARISPHSRQRKEQP